MQIQFKEVPLVCARNGQEMEDACCLVGSSLTSLVNGVPFLVLGINSDNEEDEEQQTAHYYVIFTGNYIGFQLVFYPVDCSGNCSLPVKKNSNA
uniref:Uncharacterized protein n=1 Tax=Anguilla anguilla TaxID=7936 RepID=A0A0E9W8A6_ANGAN